MVEDELITEAGSDPYAGYESRPTSELVELMNAEDSSVPEAVRAAAASISEAIDAIAERLRAGGRLVYVGAGSSGLIAALDSRHQGVRDRLVDGTGALRRHVRVFVNDEDVRALQQEATPLQPGDRVAIVPAIAGGL